MTKEFRNLRKNLYIVEEILNRETLMKGEIRGTL